MEHHNNINNAITGKSGEYKIITELMNEGFVVYTPVLDIDGVDCIIKNDKGRLIEIQIKTRNKGEGYNKEFIIRRQLEPRKNFFICCYLIDEGKYWFIPSFLFMKLSRKEEGNHILTMDLENQKELLGYQGKEGISMLRFGEYKE